MSPTRSIQPTLSRALSAVMFTSALIVIRAAFAMPADSVGMGDRLLANSVSTSSNLPVLSQRAASSF